MMRRRKTVSRFSLEVGFERRRDGWEALRGAYQHLLRRCRAWSVSPHERS